MMFIDPLSMADGKAALFPCGAAHSDTAAILMSWSFIFKEKMKAVEPSLHSGIISKMDEMFSAITSPMTRDEEEKELNLLIDRLKAIRVR